MELKTLNIVVSTGRSKELLGRELTIKELEEMDEDKIQEYYDIYEANYANKINNSINGSIISFYSFMITKIVQIDDVVKLQEDLNDSYILKHELAIITGRLSRVFGKIWALAEISLTTFRHISRGVAITEVVHEIENKS